MVSWTTLFECNAGRCLEEAAILTENLRLRISSEFFKCTGDVDDGRIFSGDINDEKGASHVDRTEVDLWLWPGGDTGEDVEHIKARSGIDWETIEGESRGARWLLWL